MRDACRAPDSSRTTHHASLAGVFLTALAGIVCQLALTRLSSAALDYDLSFQVVSAAMLGTSAGGVWVAGWLPPEDAPASDLGRARRLCLGGAAALALVLGAFAWVPLRTLSATGVLAA